jgi:hypothetical protein
VQKNAKSVAGPCVTVLKALFDETFEVPDPVVPSGNGRELVPVTSTDRVLTVGGELNKLARSSSAEGFSRRRAADTRPRSARHPLPSARPGKPARLNRAGATVTRLSRPRHRDTPSR